MSFGLNSSDFSIAYGLATSIVDACQDGPGEYRNICKDVESFRTALKWIADETTTLPPPTEKRARSRKEELEQIVDNCEIDLRQIQQLIDRYSRLVGPSDAILDRNNSRRIWDSDQVGSEDLEVARQKLLSHISTIDDFVDSLQPSVLDQIFHSIDRQWASERQHYRQTVGEQDQSLSDTTADTAGILVQNARLHADNIAWKDLQDLLVHDGIPVEDVEFSRTKIVKRVRQIVEQSAAEDSTVASIYHAINSSDVDALSHQMSQIQPTLSSTQSRNFELHTQQSGKSSFNFRIDSIQYGIYHSQPACLFVMDIWFESSPGYDLSSGEITISTNFKDLSNPRTAPSIPEFGPHSAEEDSAASRIDSNDTSTDSGQLTSTPSWTLSTKRISIRPATNLNSIRYTISASTRPWRKPLHQKHRLAFIVEHNGAEFAISVTREAALKSLISRMKINHKRRPPTVRLSFCPEVSEEALDGVDLVGLTEGKRRDGRADSGFYRVE